MHRAILIYAKETDSDIQIVDESVKKKYKYNKISYSTAQSCINTIYVLKETIHILKTSESAFKILKHYDEMNYVKIYIKIKYYHNKFTDLY